VPECPPTATMSTESIIHVLSGDSIDAGIATTVEQAARATVLAERPSTDAELSIAFVSPDEIRDLNRTYRGIDEVTDVLSFGAAEGQTVVVPMEADPYLGDVAICVARALDQARDYGHDAAREFAFLTVHGVLHLLGHDHHREDDQRRMRAAEERILERLGLSRGDG